MVAPVGTSRIGALVAVVLALSLVAGCGGDDDDDTADEAATPTSTSTTSATVPEDKPPYEITCADLADPAASADVTRRATVQLANQANIRDASVLQVSQSIFFAMTELCKGEAEDYKPARAAVAAVKRGEYRADLGEP